MEDSLKAAYLPLNTRKRILAVVAVGTFMSALDSSIVNIALPSIGSHFKQPLSVIEWVVMSYLLVISSLLLTYGRIGDIYGHKKVYIFGYVFFVIGSFLCGISPGIQWLILSRVIQALGAGMLMSLGPAIVTDITPPNERGKALGTTAVAVSVALTAGPVLGGFLTGAFGWQSIFFVNIPIGIAGWILAQKIIPEGAHMNRQPFDVPGAVLTFTGLILILLPLSYSEKYGFGNIFIIAMMAAGILTFFIFVIVEKNTKYPMVDLNLFHNRLFSMSNLSALINFMAQYSVTLLMPFYLQQLRLLTPSRAGLLMIPIPVTTMIIAPISGAISDKIDTRYLSALGMGIISVGIFMLSRLSIDTPSSILILNLVFIGLGSAMFQTPNNSAIMGCVPANSRGLASGMLATMRNAGMVLGAAVAGALFSSRKAYLMLTLAKQGLSGATLSNTAFTGALNFAFKISAVIALAAVFTSFIKGSTKVNDIKE